jgi:hypothetical protein
MALCIICGRRNVDREGDVCSECDAEMDEGGRDLYEEGEGGMGHADDAARTLAAAHENAVRAKQNVAKAIELLGDITGLLAQAGDIYADKHEGTTEQAAESCHQVIPAINRLLDGLQTDIGRLRGN